MATLPNAIRHWLTPRRWWNGLSRLLPGRLRGGSKHPFDRSHGVDTDGLLYASPDAPGHANNRHNAGYYATAPSLFHGAIDLWRATLPAAGYGIEDYTLIDIGCGKGRVLMLATGYGFREIVGVELNPRLARVARKNLRKWIRTHAEPRVRIIEADAISVPLPDGPVALFYFNSFELEMTEKWLSRLAEQIRGRTAPLDLIYIHPEHDALVRQVPGVHTIAEASIPFTVEDALADAFGVSEDGCAVYRLLKSDEGSRGRSVW